jgi:hypothetical protein
MAVSHALTTLGRLIGRSPRPPAEILEAYAHEVIPVLDRAEWLYQYWLEQSTLFTDSEKLGNVAAIHRWETATMGRSLERVIPPAVLARAHAAVIDALEMASRAAQLLSNGSRFHNAGAVCEGQAMLTASRERRLAALRSMRRYLLPVSSPRAPEIEAGQPASVDAEASQPAGAGWDAEADHAPILDIEALLATTPTPALPSLAPPFPVPPSPAPGAAPSVEPPAPPGWGALFGRSGDQERE